MTIDAREIDIAKVKVKDRYRTDKGNIEELATTIEEAGRLIQPISVDSQMNLLAGERRLLACKHLGWKKIPAIVHDVRDKITKKKIELFENISRKDFTWPERARLERDIFEYYAEHEDPAWNQRKQASLLNESKGAVSRRIQLAEAIELLPDLADQPTEDDAWKIFKKLEENWAAKELINKTAPEILEAAQWADDHYRVGDAFLGMSGIRAGLCQFAECDPPYGIDLTRVKQSRVGASTKIVNYTEIDEDEYMAFYRRAAAEVFRILEENAFAVFWFGPTWHSETRDILREVGFTLSDIPCIWYRPGPGQTNQPDLNLGSGYEPFWLVRKGQPKLAKPGRNNVFMFTPLAAQKKIHPTEKPVELLKDIIQTCCFPGSRILVPFLGSGSTLIAAYDTGNVAFGWDLSPETKELFLKRVKLETIKQSEMEEEVEENEDADVGE